MCTHFRLAQKWIGTGPSATQCYVNRAVSTLIQLLFQAVVPLQIIRKKKH